MYVLDLGVNYWILILLLLFIFLMGRLKYIS